MHTIISSWVLLCSLQVTACPAASPDPSGETSVPVGNSTDPLRKHAQGQSSLGNNQQVTMEHVGKADGINNTVGERSVEITLGVFTHNMLRFVIFLTLGLAMITCEW